MREHCRADEGADHSSIESRVERFPDATATRPGDSHSHHSILNREHLTGRERLGVRCDHGVTHSRESHVRVLRHRCRWKERRNRDRRGYSSGVHLAFKLLASLAPCFVGIALAQSAPHFSQEASRDPESIAVELPCPARGDSFAPRLLVDGDVLVLSWIEAEGPRSPSMPPLHRVCMSRYADNAWSEVSTIASGENLFANWADTPTIVRATDGRLLATWLRKSAASTYAYDIVTSQSKDDGQTWETLGPLHDDAKFAEHGFVSAQSTKELSAFCWLDGRAMELPDESAGGHGHGGGDMTLRAARTTPTNDRAAPPSEILDERVCECCPTDLAIGARGPIIVYRDRGEDGTRDIAIVRWLGEGWSLPQPVARDGWMLEGCPVNGPSISANGDDLVVAWWTGEPTNGAVRAARSNDHGASFGKPIDLDTNGSLGRVETLLLPTGDALIFWYDRDAGAGASLVCKRLSLAGTLGALQKVTSVAADRSSGFPRAVVRGTDAYLATTEVGADKSRRVRLHRVSLAALAK